MSACPAKILQSGHRLLVIAFAHAGSPDHCALPAADSPVSGTAIAAAAFGHDGALVYAAMQRYAVVIVFAGDTLQPVARIAAPGLSAAVSSGRFTDIAVGGVLKGGGATLLLATSGGKVCSGRGCVHSAVKRQLYAQKWLEPGWTTATLGWEATGAICRLCACAVVCNAGAGLLHHHESTCLAQVIEVTADGQQLLGGSGTPRIKDEAAAPQSQAAAVHHQGTPDTT